MNSNHLENLSKKSGLVDRNKNQTKIDNPVSALFGLQIRLLSTKQGLVLSIKFFQKIPLNFDKILRFLKIPQIFWKCVPIKILWKKSSEFFQLAAPKFSDFLSENWPYQQILRKILRIWILPISHKNLTNFWQILVQHAEKIQSIFYRVFWFEHFSEIWEFSKNSEEFFWEFYW